MLILEKSNFLDIFDFIAYNSVTSNISTILVTMYFIIFLFYMHGLLTKKIYKQNLLLGIKIIKLSQDPLTVFWAEKKNVLKNKEKLVSVQCQWSLDSKIT